MPPIELDETERDDIELVVECVVVDVEDFSSLFIVIFVVDMRLLGQDLQSNEHCFLMSSIVSKLVLFLLLLLLFKDLRLPVLFRVGGNLR